MSIVELIQTKSVLEVKNDDLVNPLLELRDIHKNFGRVQALKGVELSINPGEVHAIVGENGAGKSTLISIASGVLHATEGQVVLKGEPMVHPTPAAMREAGVSVAYQHPALPADLTVLECLCLVEPSFGQKGGAQKAKALLERVSTEELRVLPGQRVSDLALAQRHVVEIARALSSNPSVLILDEPTEPFQEPDVEKLFALVASLRNEGKSVIYISHRLHEVGQVADRISVLRDGELIDTRLKEDFTHDEIIRSIVGRPLGQVFPNKLAEFNIGKPLLKVSGLTGTGFHNVDLQVRPGEIVGLAGVEGQGQREFLRAMAGVEHVSSGEMTLAGTPIGHISRSTAKRAGIGFVPGDRHKEGLFMSLSVKENIALGQLDDLAHVGVVNTSNETSAAQKRVDSLSIKTISLNTPVSSLSGGNQQKVLIGREIGANPKVMLIDEPTVGVDIGSKSEIYYQLRDLANTGVAIVISSSDGVEIEGLCDRVLVFARGSVSCELRGSEVSDEKITEANLKATNRRQSSHGRDVKAAKKGLLSGNYFPAVVLAILSGLICGTTAWVNGSFISEYNLGIVLTFLAALAFISFGQLCVMMLGEIDLSLGPLAGLAVVIASFVVPYDASGAHVLLGSIAIVLLCGSVGLIQGLAVTLFNLPAVVVTLATFFGLQGLALLLRPTPTGMISESLLDVLGHQFAALPVSAIAMIVLVILLERRLFRSYFGRALRATGSNRAAGHKLGINHRVIGTAAFTLAGLLTGLGGLILSAEVGIGTATVGANYTLMSITAVVLGGASIAGGWGSFICTLFGAILVQATFSSTSFLNIGSEWQYWIVGISTLLAASLYQSTRKR